MNRHIVGDITRSNNNVDQTREIYELHAFEYIKSLLPNHSVILNGTNNYGKHTKDIIINNEISIEVKGAQPYNLGKNLRVNRIVLQEKDVHALTDPNYYLFVFNIETFGPGLFTNKCKLGCKDCSFKFILFNTKEINHLFNLQKSITILPVTKIVKLYKTTKSTNSNILRDLDVKLELLNCGSS